MVTAYCGFRPNNDEYKVMGLAPYGEPRFAEQLADLARLLPDASVQVDGRRVGWYSMRNLQRPKLAEAFDGPPREPGEPIGQREADLAASVQQLTEATLLAMARRAADLTGERNLCMAGGVALNCVANGRVLREGPFDDLWIQPAAGDAGSAIGAALAYWHLVLEEPRFPDGTTDAMSGTYLGPDIDDDEARAALEESGVAYEAMADDELFDLVSQRLSDGEIVGWCRGRMEFGPRALGNRSILADPRSPSVHRRLNLITKGRESFRPFAPAVLAERATEWFDLDGSSPYMMLVAPVRANRLVPIDSEPTDLAERAQVVRSEIPACTYVDGSARIQTVDGVANPDFRRLLERFDEMTGCPILLNTSFNRAEEPIVASPAEAIASATASGLDLLVIGRYVITGAALAAASPHRGEVEGQVAS